MSSRHASRSLSRIQTVCSAHRQSDNRSASSDRQCRGKERCGLLAARPAARLCFDREQVGRSAELLHHQATAEPPYERCHAGLRAIRHRLPA